MELIKERKVGRDKEIGRDIDVDTSVSRYVSRQSLKTVTLSFVSCMHEGVSQWQFFNDYQQIDNLRYLHRSPEIDTVSDNIGITIIPLTYVLWITHLLTLQNHE